MRTLLSIALLTCVGSAAGAADGVVTVEKLDGRVRVEVDGGLFTEYIYDLDVQPVLHPVIGPGGTRMTRLWPLDESDEREARDHRHHRGLWMTFGDINGVDFWRALDPQPKVLHDELLRAEVEDGVGVIESRNRWVNTDGRVHCTDTRTIRLSTHEGARIIDYAVSLHASEGPFTFGVDEEGMMAIRTHPELRLEGPVAKGHAINSEGDRDSPGLGQAGEVARLLGPRRREDGGGRDLRPPLQPTPPHLVARPPLRPHHRQPLGGPRHHRPDRADPRSRPGRASPSATASCFTRATTSRRRSPGATRSTRERHERDGRSERKTHDGLEGAPLGRRLRGDAVSLRAGRVDRRGAACAATSPRWPRSTGSRVSSATATPARSCRCAPRSGRGSPASPSRGPGGPGRRRSPASAPRGARRAIDHATAAREAGADAILLMPPHHWLRFGRSAQTAVGFFEDVASADIPIIVHQYPAWTKAGYTLDEMKALVRDPPGGDDQDGDPGHGPVALGLRAAQGRGLPT